MCLYDDKYFDTKDLQIVLGILGTIAYIIIFMLFPFFFFIESIKDNDSKGIIISSIWSIIGIIIIPINVTIIFICNRRNKNFTYEKV